MVGQRLLELASLGQQVRRNQTGQHAHPRGHGREDQWISGYVHKAPQPIHTMPAGMVQPL
jgi:hypothetical protein